MSMRMSSVTIYSGSPIEASLVLSFLKSYGISAKLEDDHTGTIAPFVTAGGGAGAIRVSVSIEDATEAKHLLAELLGST